MRLFRDSSLVVLSTLVRTLGSVVTGIIVARTLGPTGRGGLGLFLQFASLGSALLTLGLGQAYQYHLRRGTYGERRLRQHLVIQSLAVLAAMLLFWSPLLRVCAHLLGSEVLDAHLPHHLLFLYLNTIYSLFSFALMGIHGGVKRNSIVSVAGDMIWLLCTVLFLMVLRLDIQGAMLALEVGIAVKLILCAGPVLGLGRSSRANRADRDMENWAGMTRSLLRYGIGALIGSFMYSVVMRVDIFIINQLIGTAQVGIYTVAVSLAEFALMIPSAIGVSLFPELASMDEKNRLTTAARFARICLLLAASGGIVIALLGYPVIRLLYGQPFTPAYPTLLLLIPGVVGMAQNFSYSNLLSASGRPLSGALIFTLGALLNAALNLALVPAFGINGAALASGAAYWLIALAFLVSFSHRYAIPASDLFLPRSSDVQLIASRLAGLLRRLATVKAR